MTVDTIVANSYGPPIRPVNVNHVIEGAIYNLPDAKLGRMNIPSGEATAIDLSSARVTTGLPVAGVIGWESLKGRTLVINREKKVFQLWEGQVHFPEPATTLPIKEVSGIPHIVSRMGSNDISFAIDTGDNGGVSLVPKEFDRLVDEGWITPSPNGAQVGTVAGVHSVKSGRFAQGSLLGIDLTGMNVMSSPTGESSIGLMLLLKLNLRISNSPSLFSYALRSDPGTPISPNRMTGAILLYRGGHCVVAKLKPGGQAEKAGLMVQDEIVKIDELADKPLNIVNWHVVCRERAGKSLTLQVLRQGSFKTITLHLGAASSAWQTEAEPAKGNGK